MRIAKDTLEQEITLALILKLHGKSAAQILKKLDRRFPHGAGRLDSNWLEDEATRPNSAYLAIFTDCALNEATMNGCVFFSSFYTSTCTVATWTMVSTV